MFFSDLREELEVAEDCECGLKPKERLKRIVGGKRQTHPSITTFLKYFNLLFACLMSSFCLKSNYAVFKHYGTTFNSITWGKMGLRIRVFRKSKSREF